MQVELHRITTRDGCRLDGIWQAATRPTRIGLDACLLVHGTGGNFYNSTLLEFFADRLRALGVGVLRINTRGHDGISTTLRAMNAPRVMMNRSISHAGTPFAILRSALSASDAQDNSRIFMASPRLPLCAAPPPHRADSQQAVRIHGPDPFQI